MFVSFNMRKWHDQTYDIHSFQFQTYTDGKFHGTNMGPIWAPGGPHVGPMDLAIRVGNEVWTALAEFTQAP